MAVETGEFEWSEVTLPPSLAFGGVDYYSQFKAARALLSWQDQWSAASAQESEKLKRQTQNATGSVRDWMVEEQIEFFFRSVYENAARSMATVGMLAPLVESLFERLEHILNKTPPYRKNTVDSILILVREEGIKSMPDDLESTLRALFEYRNKMFHHGLEWPQRERQKFERRISDAEWPTSWFHQAGDANDPWIFYLSPEFISHCLDTIETIMNCVHTFLTERGHDVW